MSDIFLRDLRRWKGEGAREIEEHFLGCSGPWAPKMFKQEGEGEGGGGRFWAHARASVGGWETYYAQKPKRDL